MLSIYIFFFRGVYDHKPNLSTGSQSSNKERINIYQTLTDYQDVFKERWDLISKVSYQRTDYNLSKRIFL